MHTLALLRDQTAIGAVAADTYVMLAQPRPSDSKPVNRKAKEHPLLQILATDGSNLIPQWIISSTGGGLTYGAACILLKF